MLLTENIEINETEIIKIMDETENEIIKYYSKDALKNLIYYNSNENKYKINELLILFDEMASELMPCIELYNLDYYLIYELIDEIITEIISDPDKIKFNYNFSGNLLNNKHLFLSDELLSCEINNILIESDLNSSCLNDIHDIYSDNYDIIDLLISDEINKYQIFETSLIEMYNYELSTDIKYSYKNMPNSFYKINYNYFLEISLNDIMKINRLIAESNEKTKMLFELSDNNISELFENANNSFDEITFIGGIIENMSELLYESDEFYNKYYYEIYSINGMKYRFKKVNIIYELIEIVLNQFKHYDLRNSFKFNKEIYNLY